MKNLERKKNKTWLYACLVCLFVAAIAAGSYAREKYVQHEAEDELAQLTETVNAENENNRQTEDVALKNQSAPVNEASVVQEMTQKDAVLAEKIASLEEKYGMDIPDKTLDFKEQQATTNADIYAWIVVPGTKVDYPVLQHETDPLYYLEYNLDGSKGYPGCIYSEHYNSKDFTDRHTVLYGHNMKNGTMFGELHNYGDEQFFRENKYVYIYTEDDIFVYQIFAAHEFSNVHLLLGFDLSEDDIFLSYLQGILESREMNSNVDADTTFTSDSKILTLSTCVGGESTKRYLVQGVLLDAD